MKYNLMDVTFTIPLRYDTDDRINNIKTVLSYLIYNFDTNIILLESDKEKKIYNHIKEFLSDNVIYSFIKEDDEIFHRTKFLNIMAKQSKTPIIVNYDADIILTIQQYIDAANSIRTNSLDLCTAFSSITYNLYKQYHQRIIDEHTIDWITEQMVFAPHRHAVAQGGVVFWNKQKFIECGMENENFISWGPEDVCRVVRATKLGYKWGRVNGPLIHLEHARLLNSDGGHKFIQHNDAEFEKIKNMSPEQLKNYIGTWQWIR